LAQGLLELKPSINVTQQSDDDPQEDRTKNNQEKRKWNSRDFNPVIILNGQKNESKDNRLLVLIRE
jgi:hypothetical protein